jgi:nicotinate-nucleotide pyrophosphorylase (carboxylating)
MDSLPNLQIDQIVVNQIVERALTEDIGSGDLSSALLFPSQAGWSAFIEAKQTGVLAGLPVAEATLKRLDAGLEWQSKKHDGDCVSPAERIADLRGNLRAILSAERVALNFLQRMSGIATLTRRFAEAVAGLNVRILDTRKTAPGLRVLDKYAVRAGGGLNHRFGLYDGILVKDNHIRAAGGIENAVKLLQRGTSPMVKIEVEITSVSQVEEALGAGVDIIMLDNMTLAEMAEAVRLINRRALVEASGGVTLENVRQIAVTGVDYISVGALTHSVKALDISLEIEPS